MCTVVLRIAADGVVLAANRDEMAERPWDPPAAWWPGQPAMVGGRDRLAGGTWLAMNAQGVVAGVLNRVGSLGPAPGKRSRGELPLLVLERHTAEAAAKTACGLDAAEWRSFNLVLADRSGAWFVRGLGSGRPDAQPLAAGVHMVTAHDPDDLESPRVARHLPRFRAAAVPSQADWAAWQAILADDSGPLGTELNVPLRSGFGTVSADMIFLTSPPVWLFAPGPPNRAAFSSVPLPRPSATLT